MKKPIFAVAALSLIMLLSACGSAAPQPTATPPAVSPIQTAAPQPTEPQPTTSQPAKPQPTKPVVEYPLLVAANNEVQVDLDGDGTEETVCLVPENDSELEDWYKIKSLSINGVDRTEELYDLGFVSFSPDPFYYAITDIDTTDDCLEIAIQDWGPSDDYTTSFIRYHGGKLENLGYVEGMLYNNYSGEGDLTFPGDGTVDAYVRLRVLQTWFASVKWHIGKDGLFAVQPQELYYPVNGQTFPVTANYAVAAYESNSTSSPRTELAAGTQFTVLATDNVCWVLCENADGEQFWLHLDEEYGQYVELFDGSTDQYDVLDGLLFAD